jgi:hypothetical protein
MAIKGKGKTKSRPPARAPRREPVEVKPPFFLRRRVQVIGAFLAGIVVVVLGTWVTNGLRQQSTDKQAQADASKQRSAGLAWQSTVEPAIGGIGTISPGAPPTILPTVGTTIASLQKGKVPPDAGKTLQQAQDDAKGAIDPIKKVKLADQVRDKGFTVAEVNYFLNSQTRLVEALELYSRAAAVAAIAADASGDTQTSLADEAASIQATADQILQEGWTDYQNALFASGISQTPVPGGSSIPGGS